MIVPRGVPAFARPQRIPGSVAQEWEDLARPTRSPAEFAPAMADPLPEPARRWLTHAIAATAPLYRSVRLVQHGRIRLGASWRQFRAQQLLAAFDGFVWVVSTRVLGLPVTGFDRYTRGTGQLRHRLLGLVPVAAGEGTDVTRSAAGRLASETVFVPAAGLAGRVRWQPVDEHRATALVPVGSHTHPVTVAVADSGALQQVSMPRWAQSGRAGFGERMFTVEVHEEATFEGFTIPARISAGYEPDEAFIQLTVDRATFA